MKNDFRAAHRRPPHRFRIAPAFVANRDAKLHTVDLKELSRMAGHIKLIFGWIYLLLGLDSLQLAVRVNHEGGNLPALARDPFHAENRGDCVDSRPLRNGLKHALLLRTIEWQDLKILSPQSWQPCFG